jgi:hypothetical protein
VVPVVGHFAPQYVYNVSWETSVVLLKTFQKELNIVYLVVHFVVLRLAMGFITVSKSQEYHVKTESEDLKILLKIHLF